MGFGVGMSFRFSVGTSDLMKSQKNKGGHFAPESQGGKAPHTPGGAFDDAWTDLE